MQLLALTVHFFYFKRIHVCIRSYKFISIFGVRMCVCAVAIIDCTFSLSVCAAAHIDCRFVWGPWTDCWAGTTGEVPHGGKGNTISAHRYSFDFWLCHVTYYTAG